MSDMTYVALLRGINVGGKNKVEMSRLKAVCERLGLTEVRTYINSGNVVFNTRKASTRRLAAKIETAIEEEFGFEIRALVADHATIEKVEKAIPEHWVDDRTMRTYVMFLWHDVDDPSVVGDLPLREGMDNVIYVDGALIWQVDREYITRSGMNKVVSSPLYKSMTIRNANTVRKLAAMMRAAAA